MFREILKTTAFLAAYVGACAGISMILTPALYAEPECTPLTSGGAPVPSVLCGECIIIQHFDGCRIECRHQGDLVGGYLCFGGAPGGGDDTPMFELCLDMAQGVPLCPEPPPGGDLDDGAEIGADRCYENHDHSQDP